jgi:asparagine synthase (glutamine-hydrolysing)
MGFDSIFPSFPTFITVAGIAGIVHFDGSPVTDDALRAVTRSASHRGPDGVFYQRSKDCGLAHLALHANPANKNTSQLLRREQDGRIWLITADARIDNRTDLMSSLGIDVERRPTDDGELILLAFLKWNVACVQHLIGDFSFAIWDADNQTLFCARDALGVNPLHYATLSHGLCVASEAQQILQHPQVKYRLNDGMVGEYLVGANDDPQASFFAGIKSLAPGHTLLARRSGTQVARYWHPEELSLIEYSDPCDYTEHFRELFTTAVTDRIRDVERVAITVSGGLDSSSIAAVAHRSTHDVSVHGFTQVYDQLVQCDERTYSQHLTRELGIAIEPVPTERFWLLADESAFRPRRESPFQAFTSCERYVYQRCQHLGIKVLLTGQGGDSLLTGTGVAYLDRLVGGDLSVFRDMHSHAKLRNQSMAAVVNRYLTQSLIPNSIKSTLRARLPWRDPAIPAWIEPHFAQRIGLSHRLRHHTQITGINSRARCTRISEMLYPGTVARAIYYLDQTASEFGIECRHPFLDRRLVDYVLSLPDEQFPQNKTYSTSFIHFSLRKVSADKVYLLFTAPICEALGFVSGAKLRRAWESFRAGTTQVEGATLWFPATLEIWLRHYHRDIQFNDVSAS